MNEMAEHDSVAEKRRILIERTSASLELGIFAFGFVISMIVTIVTTGDLKQSLYFGPLLSLTGYSTTVLARMLLNQVYVAAKMDELSKMVQSSSISNNTHNMFTQKVLRLFEEQDVYLAKPTIHAFSNFITNLKVESNFIEINGESIAIDAYNEFWRMLTEKQASVHDEEEQISVFVAHSSSIKIWKSELAPVMLGIQKLFIETGGKIYRTIIRNKGGEDYQLYAEVVDNMKRDKVNVYFIDNSINDRKLINEFVVVKINADWYALIWAINREESGLYGSINGCRIYKGQKAQEYFEQWKNLLTELENLPRDHIPLEYPQLREKPIMKMASNNSRMFGLFPLKRP